MKLLIKFPTRQRPELFLKRLDKYTGYLADPDLCEIVVTADLDDPSMNNELMKARINGYPNVRICYGNCSTKIQACNADVPQTRDWQILLLASDDMDPEIPGYDQVIREKMQFHYPDTDGVLFFNDGVQGEQLDTLCILGRAYYERFGYIYHPDYVSFYCDNEFMEVARHLNKLTYFPEVIIRHRHFFNEKTKPDALYKRNGRFNGRDKKTFERRKRQGFDLETSGF